MTLNNVLITATIPTSGYAPGQLIPLEININNKSNKNILEFKVELNKVSVGNYKLLFFGGDEMTNSHGCF